MAKKRRTRSSVKNKKFEYPILSIDEIKWGYQIAREEEADKNICYVVRKRNPAISPKGFTGSYVKRFNLYFSAYQYIKTEISNR